MLAGVKRLWNSLDARTRKRTIAGTVLAVLAGVIVFAVAHPVIASCTVSLGRRGNESLATCRFRPKRCSDGDRATRPPHMTGL
jgi:hypothetical protein